MRKNKVVHLSSAHPRNDIRIFYKECMSLSKQAYEVHLVVADGLGNDFCNNLIIHDVKKCGGRYSRAIVASSRILKKSFSLRGDIYHLHDPELLWVGALLTLTGKSVIFDSHEDVPQQLLNKPYYHPKVLRVISYLYKKVESFICSRLRGVIAATPFIAIKFKAINANTINVCNYPILNEFILNINLRDELKEICYVGGLSAARGVRQIASAMSLVQADIRLNLVGGFSEKDLVNEMRLSSGWKNIIEHGILDRVGVSQIYSRSRVGLVTLLPISNYLDSLPIKMFEYMSAGIPVIASDFPLWKDIIYENKCGICVDPMDPSAIAKAINYLIEHPDEARQMGENGRKAVLLKYNWAQEEIKLIKFYEQILSA